MRSASSGTWPAMPAAQALARPGDAGFAVGSAQHAGLVVVAERALHRLGPSVVIVVAHATRVVSMMRLATSIILRPWRNGVLTCAVAGHRFDVPLPLIAGFAPRALLADRRAVAGAAGDVEGEGHRSPNRITAMLP